MKTILSAPSPVAPATTARRDVDSLAAPQPMKVSFVQTQAENAGAQEVARQLALGAERNGWKTRQIFFFRRTGAFDDDANVFYCARKRPASPLGVLKLFYELFKEFRREAPDAVVAFQHYGNVIAAPIARLAGVRLIVANQVSPAEIIPAPVRLVDRLLGQFGAYDHVVVNSVKTAADYEQYPRSYSRRVVRIDHGFHDKSTAIEKSAARRELGLPQDVELLGCAARLDPLKQLDLAIDLLTLDARQHLLIAGQGPDMSRLETHARGLGVDGRVHFAGELSTARMGAFLAALDCFVCPSAIETFGLAPVEAAQAGLPVIANDLEVLRDVLAFEGQPCALFVDVRDTAAFAAQVRRALDDRALNAELGSRGRRLAERYPLEKMVDEFLRLISVKNA
jgi:glycosyltransferase involved in cell wall biosynthesis